MSICLRTRACCAGRSLRLAGSMKAMFPKIVVILIILALVASIACPPAYAQEAEASLTIRVLDPLGRPLEKIEVHLIKGSEVRRFLTNSTGYAEFRHLTAGEYLARVKLDDITLAERKVSVPEDKLVELTARVSEV
ncbi:MAG: carboxypeptidase regulatory-like domain-containing protein, partial [Thaumarchaeota archaeon]|nr:carboxypeptidase regulatory-like domain-containing protein [Nitrososphaerota archaeon]